MLDVLASNDVINDPDNGVDEMHATFFVQTHSSADRGNGPYGPELLKRIHDAEHRIEIHTGNGPMEGDPGNDHEHHYIRATEFEDNTTEIPPYDANGDNQITSADGQNRLESDLIQAKLFLANLEVNNMPVGIPTPLWVRPPTGRTWWKETPPNAVPEPIPNLVKDTYTRANLYLGPVHSNGYASGYNWIIDSGDTQGLTPTQILAQLETLVAQKVNPPFNHKKLIILFHDVTGDTPIGDNFNQYIKKIDDTLRANNKALACSP